MKFLVENWWYFLIVFIMAFMMFRRGSCCRSNSQQKTSEISSGKNMNSCCKDKPSTKENRD